MSISMPEYEAIPGLMEYVKLDMARVFPSFGVGEILKREKHLSPEACDLLFAMEMKLDNFIHSVK